MERSTDRILTTHVGSLPRPDYLLELDQQKRRGEAYDEAEHTDRLRRAVAEIVRRQVELGVDVVNDGEYGKSPRAKVDYGPWMFYVYERLTGWEPYEPGTPEPEQREEEPLVARRPERRDWTTLADFYQEEVLPALRPPSHPSAAPTYMRLWFTGPVSYVGEGSARRDVEDLRAALSGVDVREAFMTAVAPESFARGRNRYYRRESDFLYALADAMRTEYRAIVDAGFVLQIDDPGLAENWDQIDDSVSVEEYRRFAETTVEVLNHALSDVPEDRVRYHICWGSWHGPHTTDLPLADVVDIMLKVRAQAYVVEAGNARHEHEWRVWQDTKLPDGKILMPGVVSHATNVVEHPQVVADRIIRYANVVGRENVVASTDCGLGGRIHPSLAWAKLGALAEGAALATKELWGR